MPHSGGSHAGGKIKGNVWGPNQKLKFLLKNKNIITQDKKNQKHLLKNEIKSLLNHIYLTGTSPGTGERLKGGSLDLLCCES